MSLTRKIKQHGLNEQKKTETLENHRPAAQGCVRAVQKGWGERDGCRSGTTQTHCHGLLCPQLWHRKDFCVLLGSPHAPSQPHVPAAPVRAPHRAGLSLLPCLSPLLRLPQPAPPHVPESTRVCGHPGSRDGAASPTPDTAAAVHPSPPHQPLADRGSSHQRLLPSSPSHARGPWIQTQSTRTAGVGLPHAPNARPLPALRGKASTQLCWALPGTATFSSKAAKPSSVHGGSDKPGRCSGEAAETSSCGRCGTGTAAEHASVGWL